MRTVPVVSLYHPQLDRWHDFPATAVPQMRSAGWLDEKPEAKPKPRAKAPAVKTTADDGGEENELPQWGIDIDEES